MTEYTYIADYPLATAAPLETSTMKPTVKISGGRQRQHGRVGPSKHKGGWQPKKPRNRHTRRT